jgi:hypothetical protein
MPWRLASPGHFRVFTDHNREVKGPITFETFAGLACGLKLPMGLIIDEFELTAEGGKFDSESNTFGTAKPAQVFVRISEASLTQFLVEQMPPPLRDPCAIFQGDSIAVTASARVIVDITATAICKMRVHEGKELYIDLISVDKPGPVHGLVEKQLEKLNPVFKTSDLPVPTTLLSAKVIDGYLVAQGEVDLTR